MQTCFDFELKSGSQDKVIKERTCVFNERVIRKYKYLFTGELIVCQFVLTLS